MVELPNKERNRLLRVLGYSAVDVSVGLFLLVGASLSLLYFSSWSLRAVFGLPVLLFLPGYTLLLVLFPHDHSTSVSTVSDAGVRPAMTNISLGERLSLSFGMSLALIPILGLVLLQFGQSLGTMVLVGILLVLIAVGLLFGEYRRQQLPESERYSLPVARWLTGVTAAFTAEDTATRGVNIALALAIILAMSTLGYALVVPNTAEQYSSMSLLTQGENGEFVASDYPSTLTTGTTDDIFVSVTNNEGAATSYTLVVELQRIDTTSGEPRVIETQELTRTTQSVAAGETWTANPSIQPELTGTDMRLVYLLYKGDAPESPDMDNAYRSTYVWVSVQ
ncbi:DUF1616 domain-containing protein [Haloferax namakaokahaiae]|uniref:DUF1616 domain-containing protein n=1 Tax=Haloferax namakaokahaiae TaxID=1748331 RepID=A0ABD5ZJM8_9EURY